MGAVLSYHAALEFFHNSPQEEHVLAGKHVRARFGVLAGNSGDTERTGFPHVQPRYGAPVHVSGVRIQVRALSKDFFSVPVRVYDSMLTSTCPQIAHK